MLSHDYWNSAKGLVERSVLAHQRLALESFRRETLFKKAMYYGHFEGYRSLVEEKIAAFTRPGSPAREYLMTSFPRINLTAFLVDLQAQAYRTPPRRSLVAVNGAAPEEAAALLPALMQDLGMDGCMRLTERMVTLLGSVLVHVRGDDFTGHPQLSVISLDRVWPLLDPDFPNRLEAVHGLAIELPAACDPYRLHGARFLRYLPQDGLWRLDVTDISGHVLHTCAGDDLPLLPCLPLVKVDAHDSDEFFLHGGDDLLEEAVDKALQLADLRLSRKFSALPQVVISGVDEGLAANLTVGPGTVVTLPDTAASMQYLRPDVDWEALQRTISEDIKLWMLSRGVPPTELDTADRDKSGEARFQARQPLMERRADMLPLWQDTECRLWKVLACYMDEYWFKGGQGLAGSPSPCDTIRWQDFRLAVSFDQPKPLQTETQRLENWQKKMAMGVADAADYLADQMGISREDALVLLRQRAQQLACAGPETGDQGARKPADPHPDKTTEDDDKPEEKE